MTRWAAARGPKRTKRAREQRRATACAFAYGVSVTFVLCQSVEVREGAITDLGFQISRYSVQAARIEIHEINGCVYVFG
jgi:hypothetical protein